MPFDFAIHKPKLALIEFQGIQHYEGFAYYGGEKGIKYRRCSDQIKREYCERRNIPFLEIRYDQTSDIPRLLDEFIKDLK